MATFSSSEARKHLGELLDRVARGEEIVITRHDKPVARIVPEGGRPLEPVRRAIQSIRENRERMARRKGFKPLTDKEITRLDQRRAQVNPGFVADASVGAAWVVESQSTFTTNDGPLVRPRRRRGDQQGYDLARAELGGLRPLVDTESPQRALGSTAS
jgi:prevent-host-death family protein